MTFCLFKPVKYCFSLFLQHDLSCLDWIKLLVSGEGLKDAAFPQRLGDRWQENTYGGWKSS